MQLEAGAVVNQYVVESRIGSGGMAVVYRVRHRTLGTTHALKLLTVATPEISRRLLQEGRAQGALRHPNVVTVTDTVEVGGMLGLVMEFVDGPSLARLLSETPLTLDQADHLARGIIRGVAAAHKAGLVHRDLKPQNILLAFQDERLTPKIADFGLVRALGGDGIAQTRTGMGMGTPPYMAPEQIRDAKSADERSDIFSLGAVLYELVVGRRAFPGNDMYEVFTRIQRGSYAPLDALTPPLPGRMEEAIRGALVVDRGERIASCEQLLVTWVGDDTASLGQSDTWAPEFLGRAREWTSEAELPPSGGLETFSESALMASTTASPQSQASLPATRTVGPELDVSRPPRTRRSVLRWGLGLAVALAGGSTWLTQRTPPPPPERPTVHFTRLTFDGARIPAVDVSPDGQSIVYERDDELYLRRLDGTRAFELTADFEPPAWQPAWSPDGRQIAFSSHAGLYVMGASGESPIRVASAPAFHPAWSPDGTQILYVTVLTVDPFLVDFRGELHVLDVASGEVRTLLGQDANPRSASWSPSGTRVAYWSGDRNLWTTSVDEPDPRELVSTPDYAELQPVWAPDGRSVRYLSERSGAMNVWSAPIDEQTGAPTADPEPLTRGLLGTVWMFSQSGDGSRLVYTGVDLPTTLWSASLDPDGGAMVGEPTPFLRGTRMYRVPSLSPDGEQVVVDLRGPQEDLYVLKLDGSGLRQLTDDAFRDRGPHWSPAGDSIWFFSNRPEGTYALWRISPDGSGLRRVSGDEHLWPRSMFGGDALSVAGNQLEPVVVLIDAQTGARTGPTFPGGLVTDWNVDGLAAVSRVGGSAIWDPDSGEVTELEGGGCQWPKWLGTERVVCLDGDTLVSVHVHTGERRDLLTLDEGVFPGPDPFDVSADGRTLVYSVEYPTSDLWAIDLVGRGGNGD